MILAVLSALAEPTRLAAMRIFDDGDEHFVCDPMRRLDATQSRISRHMQILKQAGLVVDRRDAQWLRYQTRPDPPEHLRALLAAALVDKVFRHARKPRVATCMTLQRNSSGQTSFPTSIKVSPIDFGLQ